MHPEGAGKQRPVEVAAEAWEVEASRGWPDWRLRMEQDSGPIRARWSHRIAAVAPNSETSATFPHREVPPDQEPFDGRTASRWKRNPSSSSTWTTSKSSG